MEFLLPIAIFAITTSLTPGPNNIMMMASGVNHGTRKSLPHYFGICFGFPTMLVLVGMGFGVVFETFPLLHHLIKLVGIVYLLYLSWLIATAVPTSLNASASPPLTFWQAVLFQWVNPKAWMMVTGAVATYTTATADIFLQVLAIALVFFVVSFHSAGVWLLFGVWLKRFLQDTTHQRAFNGVMALLLVASVVPMVFEFIHRSI